MGRGSNPCHQPVSCQPRGARSFVTLAAYHLRQENVPTTDLSSSLFQVQSGEVRLRGVEVEATAALPGGLTLTASYA